MKMQLGDRVTDKLTGFSGVVVGMCQYLTGCEQAQVKPTELKDDGTMKDSAWFDSQRLEVIEKNVIEFDNSETPGGPQHW